MVLLTAQHPVVNYKLSSARLGGNLLPVDCYKGNTDANCGRAIPERSPKTMRQLADTCDIKRPGTVPAIAKDTALEGEQRG